jgi:hypothetical protein
VDKKAGAQGFHLIL